MTADGKFLGFDQSLVKGVKDTTSKMSSKLDDKDCDGIAFLNDNSKKEHLVFAELNRALMFKESQVLSIK